MTLGVFGAGDESDVSDSAVQSETRAASATPTSSLEERRHLAESLDDPLNRYYRYPAARALLRVAGGLPLRPDHITYLHTMTGIAGAALLAVSVTRTSLVVAFLLLEIRMILDCYDGVLARAKKLSSPRGRTLDELGDAVAYIAICIGMNVRVARLNPSFPTELVVAFGAVVLLAGAMSGHAYDFYMRRLGSALKEGRDAIADELEQKHELVRSGRAKWITRFGIWFDRWQVRLYEPRYAGGNAVATVVARAHRTGVRFLVKLIGFISWDNVLGMISLGVLLDRVLEVELIALTYGVVMFTTARVTIWRVLGSGGR
jgi:phosphatidylglycerophosphate synthase